MFTPVGRPYDPGAGLTLATGSKRVPDASSAVSPSDSSCLVVTPRPNCSLSWANSQGWLSVPASGRPVGSWAATPTANNECRRERRRARACVGW
eukprot:gene16038-biopygen17225